MSSLRYHTSQICTGDVYAGLYQRPWLGQVVSCQFECFDHKCKSNLQDQLRRKPCCASDKIRLDSK